MRRIAIALAAVAAALGFAARGGAEDRETGEPKRAVLVELFTSQGCDMCPEAERLLGELAGLGPDLVPVAFHVDYFNDPWKDPYSDALYSRRQMAYNAAYKGPKHPEYGLYYTPMVMVDGVETVNGRDGAGLAAAIRRARARKPEVALRTTLRLEPDGRSGEVKVEVSALSRAAEGRELLVCAVLRDDKAVTRVPSGENAGKSLVARFPAIETKYEFVKLSTGKKVTPAFTFRPDPAREAARLSLAIFVQDRHGASIYQAATLPWKATATSAEAPGVTPPPSPRPRPRTGSSDTRP